MALLGCASAKVARVEPAAALAAVLGTNYINRYCAAAAGVAAAGVAAAGVARVAGVRRITDQDRGGIAALAAGVIASQSVGVGPHSVKRACGARAAGAGSRNAAAPVTGGGTAGNSRAADCPGQVR